MLIHLWMLKRTLRKNSYRICLGWGVHLQEAVVAEKERRAVDTQVEDAVVAGRYAQANGRRHQLHPLTPLHLQHAPHSPHHDLRNEHYVVFSMGTHREDAHKKSNVPHWQSCKNAFFRSKGVQGLLHQSCIDGFLTSRY